MLVTGYPWYDIRIPAHVAFVDKFTKRTGRHPVAGALVGYITFLSAFETIRKAQGTDTEAMVSALESLKVETPIGPITFRPFDHQSTMGAWVGVTKLDATRGTGIMDRWEYVPGDKASAVGSRGAPDARGGQVITCRRSGPTRRRLRVAA